MEPRWNPWVPAGTQLVTIGMHSDGTQMVPSWNPTRNHWDALGTLLEPLSSSGTKLVTIWMHSDGTQLAPLSYSWNPTSNHWDALRWNRERQGKRGREKEKEPVTQRQEMVIGTLALMIRLFKVGHSERYKRQSQTLPLPQGFCDFSTWVLLHINCYEFLKVVSYGIIVSSMH